MALPGHGSVRVENETIRRSNLLELESMPPKMPVLISVMNIVVPRTRYHDHGSIYETNVVVSNIELFSNGTSVQWRSWAKERSQSWSRDSFSMCIPEYMNSFPEYLAHLNGVLVE